MNKRIFVIAAVFVAATCIDTYSPSSPSKALTDPKAPSMRETAPARYRVLVSTSKGEFTVEVTRSWAPLGADRFYNLVRNRFFDDVRFFRVLKTNRPLLAQFGISGDPAVTAIWGNAVIRDDPVTQHNSPGMLSFATAGKHGRTTEVFINYGDNSYFDDKGFAPFGKVVSGLDVVDQLCDEYGEVGPRGTGPKRDQIAVRGNSYLKQYFPKLDFIKTARIIS